MPAKNFPENTRIYAKPVGFGEKGEALSFPLAGGPLSFQAIHLIFAAGGKRVYETTFPLTALSNLKTDLPKALSRQLEKQIENLTSKRHPIGRLTFDRPLLMGILNLTPDSFSDGGEFLNPTQAKARAEEIFREGADIIDIGGESTRPGAKPVPEKEELQRISPVLDIIGNLPGPVSVDTRKAGIMKAAVKGGALLINDVSALTFDEKAIEEAKKARGVILMHAKGSPEDMQKNPKYGDVVLEVFDYLEGRIKTCEKAGIPRSNLIIDPGIGFGKNDAHNQALLRDLALFQALGVAVLAGVSRKRFIGELTGEKDPKKRGAGSIAASLFALSRGAQILRCHDVADIRQALDIYQSLTSFG